MVINYLYRPKPLPRYLAFVTRDTNLKKDFTMLDTRTGKCIGRMFTKLLRNYKNDEIYPYVRECDSLYIETLKINEKYRRKGYGSEFIKLVQNESRLQNCQGRVHLIASSNYDTANPSHIFYRKKGFKTVYDSVNIALDSCIKSGEQKYFEQMYMYLPIGDKAPESIFTKFKNFIDKMFK